MDCNMLKVLSCEGSGIAAGWPVSLFGLRPPIWPCCWNSPKGILLHVYWNQRTVIRFIFLRSLKHTQPWMDYVHVPLHIQGLLTSMCTYLRPSFNAPRKKWIIIFIDIGILFYFSKMFNFCPEIKCLLSFSKSFIEVSTVKSFSTVNKTG